MNTHMDRHASRIEDRLGVLGEKKFRFHQNIAYVDPKISNNVFLSYVYPKTQKSNLLVTFSKWTGTPSPELIKKSQKQYVQNEKGRTS